MSIHLAFFSSLISLFLFYHFLTIWANDLFGTVKRRVSGVLAVIFLIIILVCKHQLS
jgi:hypothetical protein